MDHVDRKILAELQQEGNLTVTDLAARVRLSISGCHRRVRELERTGTIRGYRAVVDPAAVGLNFEVVAFITLRQADPDTVASFEQALAEIPHVVQAERLIGNPDYLLRIVTADLTEFQRLHDEHVATLPSIQRLNTTVVLKHVVEAHPLPELPIAGRFPPEGPDDAGTVGSAASRRPA
jgi:DNA-binding Lrp family transcriptional regulator